jgi:hypothetical protein
MGSIQGLSLHFGKSMSTSHAKIKFSAEKRKKDEFHSWKPDFQVLARGGAWMA